LAKMANISGTGRGAIFASVPSIGGKRPEPAALGRPPLGDGDALSAARRVHIEILVEACPWGEMPWRGHHWAGESVVAHRRSQSRLADERPGSGKALPRPRKTGSDNQGFLALSETTFLRDQAGKWGTWFQ
jgi:hypothetical protein